MTYISCQLYLQLTYFSTIVPQPYYYFDKCDEAFDTWSLARFSLLLSEEMRPFKFSATVGTQPSALSMSLILRRGCVMEACVSSLC